MHVNRSISPLNPQLLHIEAGPQAQKAKSLGILGLFSRGSKKSRINIKIGNSTSDRFNIAAEKHSPKSLTKGESKRSILIKVQVEGEAEPTYLKVNRNSLIKRLGIDIKDLQLAENKGIDSLSSFVAGQAKAIATDAERTIQDLAKNESELKAMLTSSQQLFDRFPKIQNQSEREKTFSLINKIMRTIDPSDALLEALGPQEAQKLKQMLTTYKKEINELKDSYKDVQQAMKFYRKSIGRQTALSSEDIRFFAVYGNEREKQVATKPYLTPLTTAEKENYQTLIEEITTKLGGDSSVPVQGYEFLWDLSSRLPKKHIIDILKTDFSKIKNKKGEMLTPPEMLTTLKQIADHLKSSKHNPHYAKKDAGLNFGWSTDARGHIYIRTGRLVGAGAFKKATEEICLNTGKKFASISVKGKKNIAEAKKGNKIAKWLQSKGVQNILKPSISEYMTETKTNAKGQVSQKWTIRVPVKERVGVLINERNDNQPPVSVDKLLRIAKGIAQTLAQMHDLDWVHGDIKPDNIVLGTKKTYAIDFDGACEVGEELANVTPRYLPSEVHDRREVRVKTKELDAFSFGATLIDLMINRRLDLIVQNKTNYKNIKTLYGPQAQGTQQQKNLAIHLEFKDALERPGLDRFIQDLKDGLKATNRYAGEDLVKVEKMLDIVKGLINPDPKKRMKCDAALERLNSI